MSLFWCLHYHMDIVTYSLLFCNCTAIWRNLALISCRLLNSVIAPFQFTGIVVPAFLANTPFWLKTNQKQWKPTDVWNKRVYWDFTDVSQKRDSFLRQEVSGSPAARPVSRNNLSARLKKQGSFIRGLRERKFFKFILVLDKDGGQTWSEKVQGYVDSP